MSLVFLLQIREQESRTGPVGEGGEEVGKGYKKVHMVQILCTHIGK
jgi:hypothetical protein